MDLISARNTATLGIVLSNPIKEKHRLKLQERKRTEGRKRWRTRFHYHVANDQQLHDVQWAKVGVVS